MSDEVDRMMAKIEAECNMLGHMPRKSELGVWYCWRCQRLIAAPKRMRKNGKAKDSRRT